MTAIQLTGSLPAQISEDTQLWDWVGQLRLSIDPNLIRFVDISGLGGDFFDVALNRATGVLTIRPLARADYEWFVANNISTTLSFKLRFFMQDGSLRESAGSYSITLLNVDDTPPQALSFASGGTVTAGAAGVSIGRLLVTDPDTVSGFTFTIREDDQWMFEMVGNLLRLRPGVSIPLADGPERELVVTVSDGRQSAALTLQIGVTATGFNNGGTVDVMESHESTAGFRWVSPSNLFSMRMSHEIATIRDYGSLIYLQMRDGGAVAVEQPAVIDLLDGYITFSGKSLAARVWTIYETVLNREPRHGEMAAGVASLAAGAAQEALIADLLNGGEFVSTFGNLNNLGFAERMYRNSTGVVDQNGAAWHAGNLDQGRARSTVANGFVNWRIDSLKHADQRAENGGLFVPRDWVAELEHLQPTKLGDATFAHWWADQIITGALDLSALPADFMRAQGLLPGLDAGGTLGALVQLFGRMTGAPAESIWTESFNAALLKTGMTPADYLQSLVKDLDLDELHANLNPQGVTFQAGW